MPAAVDNKSVGKSNPFPLGLWLVLPTEVTVLAQHSYTSYLRLGEQTSTKFSITELLDTDPVSGHVPKHGLKTVSITKTVLHSRPWSSNMTRQED